jgi:hypothetical protein
MRCRGRVADVESLPRARGAGLPCDERLPVIGQNGVRIVSSNRSNRRRRLGHAVAAAARLVLAFAVLLGIVHSGGRYFYCEALGLLPSDPCAEAARDDHNKSPLGVLGERRADCCEIVTLAAMPQAAQASGPGVAPAARVAVMPACGLAGWTDFARPSRRGRAFERWRPPPRASNDVRAQLMVFLI